MSSLKKRVSRQSNEEKLPELIEKIVINDESWKCIVVMLVETDHHLMEYISVLNQVCQNGVRKAICAFSREKILSSINKPIVPSLDKPTPSLQRLRQKLRSSLPPEDDNSIPTSLEGALVKWMIYEEKQKLLAREVANAQDAKDREQEFLAMQFPPGSKASRPGTARKPNSKLRKRGEEWKDIDFIDDAPYNGPNLYILLTGFYNPSLPHELINIGVPLRCIFKLDHFKLTSCETDLSNDLSSSFHSSMMSRSTLRLSNECHISGYDFWTEFNSDNLCDLMIRDFCPPWYPSSKTRQIYDNISFTMYDIYDNLQSHVRYLKNMRLVSVHDPGRPPVSRREYDDFMSNVPEECASIYVVLDAILYQVDQELREDVDEEKFTDESPNEEEIDPVDRLSAKLNELNLKYELVPDSPCEEACNYNPDPELVLHGDKLALDVCRTIDGAEEWRITKHGAQRQPGWTVPEGIFGRKILAAPWINEAWNATDHDELDVIKLLMPGILSCCANEGIDPYRAKHIFNLLDFRRSFELIKDENRQSSRANTLKTHWSSSSISDLRKSRFSRGDQSLLSRRSRILSFISSRNVVVNDITSIKSLNLSCSDSEGTICGDIRLSHIDHEYHLLHYFENCTSIFGLLNARESLGLDASGNTHILKLESYEDAEMLSTGAFLQILTEECEPEFSRKLVRWFGPTESVLVMYFDEQHEVGEVMEGCSTFALRTPVCLRDFCDYVAPEESEWLKAQSETAGRKVEACRNRTFTHDSMDVVWEDACFVLPGSLKARDLLLAQSGDHDGNLSVSLDRSSLECLSILNQATLITPPSVDYLGYEEPLPCFIGYDLGDRRRVQVTHTDGLYDGLDGTRVRYGTECWLLGHPDSKTRTTKVWMSNDAGFQWKLGYHETDDERGTWQLHTKSNIIMAFERLEKFPRHAMSTELLYKIQISWPSGLIIKPTEYTNCEYSFFVLQYYITKGPACKAVEKEICRKYLPNGDVVKFMNDSSVIILSPNGRIITIPDLEKGESNLEMEGSRTFRKGEFDYFSVNSQSLLVDEEIFNGNYPIPRFEVLESDGRHYEVLNCCEIRELNRSRLIVCEEYDFEEKFVRRDDGTDMLFTAEAELIVDFPDGTRMLSSCQIEDKLEIEIYSDGEEGKSYEESIEEVFDDGDYDREDSFVFVILNWRAEHPNYATVTRRKSMCSVTMGAHEMALEIDPRGLGVVRCGDKAQITLQETEVLVSQHVCEVCSTPKSLGTFYPAPRKNFFEFTDRKQRVKLRRLGPPDNDSAKIAMICDQRLRPKPCCRQLDLHRTRLPARIFAVQKDNTVYEYQHKRVRRDLERHQMTSGNESFVGQKDRKILLLPIGKSLGTKRDWLLDYTIQEAKPTLKFNPEEDMPITLDLSWHPPQFLMARLLTGACKPHENSLISMQRALMDFWQEVAMHQHEDLEGDLMAVEMLIPKNDFYFDLMKHIIKRRMKTIDVKVYEEGRKRLEELRQFYHLKTNSHGTINHEEPSET